MIDDKGGRSGGVPYGGSTCEAARGPAVVDVTVVAALRAEVTLVLDYEIDVVFKSRARAALQGSYTPRERPIEKEN
jgi:hypothetical protein